MNPRIKAGLLIILLVSMSIPGRPIKFMAHADGASSVEQVFISWDTDQSVGTGASQDGSSSLESNVAATYNPTYFNITTLDVDQINVTSMQVYVQWRDTNDIFSQDWVFSVWERTNDIDAGALVNYQEYSIQNADGTPWIWGHVPVVINPQWNLSAGDYFFGVNAEGGAGDIRAGYETTGTTGGRILSNTNIPPAMNPFIEWTWADNEEYSITIQYNAYKEELTEENTYVGNVTHFVARRDLNYTFPAWSENELIQMTVPIEEGVTNITRYNGGAWDTILAEAEYEREAYNGTHDILSILEATISAYGGLYRVYTSTYEFYYEIGGAFWENGTSYGPVNITATTEAGSTSIEIDGHTIVAQDTEIVLFQWDVGNAVRFHYTRLSQEAFNVYFPEDTYATYEFEIRDLTGDLQSHSAESHLESLRYVNNSLDVIERVAIADVVNDVPLTLVTYQVYRLRVLHPDEHVINFGILVSGVISNPVLVIDQIEFSQQAQITYQYVTVEAIRPSPTQITVNYNDSLAQTTSVAFYLEFRNGTDVYNETVVEDNYQFNFAGVDPYTDYKITVVINHEFFGTLTHEEIISITRSFNPAPSWSIMGTLGPIQVGNIISLFLCLILALGFSAVNAEVGGFTGLSLAFVLRSWGWNDFDYTTIGICMGIVLVVGMVRRST